VRESRSIASLMLEPVDGEPLHAFRTGQRAILMGTDS
jgi:hypothetical protein